MKSQKQTTPDSAQQSSSQHIAKASSFKGSPAYLRLCRHLRDTWIKRDFSALTPRQKDICLYVMLQMDVHKTEIARILDIGRATVYRHIPTVLLLHSRSARFRSDCSALWSRLHP